jgi:hypothetical protein
MDLPRDTPFWAEDAYGDLKFVRFARAYTAEAPARFGPFFEVIDSDGEVLSREDIMGWSFDRTELEAAYPAAPAPAPNNA